MEKRGIGTIVFFRMLILIAIACLASSVQYVARIEVGINHGYFLSGHTYSYNLISYFIGLLLFVMGLIAFSSKPDVKIYGSVGMACIWNIIGSVIMCIAMMITEIATLGLYDSMDNGILMAWTFGGWPLLTFITMNKVIDNSKHQNDYTEDNKESRNSFTFEKEEMIKFIGKNMLILAVVFVSWITLILFCLYKLYNFSKDDNFYVFGRSASKTGNPGEEYYNSLMGDNKK